VLRNLLQPKNQHQKIETVNFQAAKVLEEEMLKLDELV
jgi:hypothetical protein